MDPGDEYDKFVKNHANYNENTCDKKSLRKIAYDFIKLKTGQCDTSTVNCSKGTDHKKAKDRKCYWLVFEAKDCNTFYSNLVYCRSKEEAITIMSVDYGIQPSNLDAKKMKLKNIDTMNKYFN